MRANSKDVVFPTRTYLGYDIQFDVTARVYRFVVRGQLIAATTTREEIEAEVRKYAASRKFFRRYVPRRSR